MLYVMKTPDCDQKAQKYLAIYHYIHLALLPPDRMMGKSLVNYLNLLHTQSETLENSRKSGLIQNEQSLEWSLLLNGQ